MRAKEQGQQLEQVEVNLEVSIEGSSTSPTVSVFRGMLVRVIKANPDDALSGVTNAIHLRIPGIPCPDASRQSTGVPKSSVPIIPPV